jgi:ATP-dependent helicase HrpA
MYPGIEDTGAAVRLRLFANRDAALHATRHGVVRLAALACPQQHDLVARQCANDRDLALLAAAAGFDRRLFHEVADRAVADALGGEAAEVPRSEAEFTARVEAARAEIVAHGERVARSVKAVLLAVKEARGALDLLRAPAYAAGRQAVSGQLDSLLAPGWVRVTPAAAFAQLYKYVTAAARRARRLSDDVTRDRRLEGEVAPFEVAFRALSAKVAPAEAGPELERLRWMIEEFRLSLFAQELRTAGPVSARRLEAQLDQARAEVAGG